MQDEYAEFIVDSANRRAPDSKLSFSRPWTLRRPPALIQDIQDLDKRVADATETRKEEQEDYNPKMYKATVSSP